MRNLIVGVVVALAVSSPAAAALPPKENGEETKVSRAFEIALDQSRPLSERLAAIEDGRKLRRTLESLRQVAPRVGVDFSSIHARVRGVTVHGRRAEVDFELLSRSTVLPGVGDRFGVAVREDRRWLVSRFTICRLANLAGVSCRGRDPFTSFAGKPIVPQAIPGTQREVSLTFVDGTSIAVSLPDVFEFSRFMPHARAEVECRDACLGRSITLHGFYKPRNLPTLTRYPGHEGGSVRLDYWGQLNFDAGDWFVRADVEQFAENERAFVARSVYFNLTPDGFFEYIGDPSLPLRFPIAPDGPSMGRALPPLTAKGVIDYDAGVPILEFTPSITKSARGDGSVMFAVSGCDDDGAVRRPAGASSDYHAGQRCFPGTGIELGVEGSDQRFVDSMLNETALRVLRPRPDRIAC